jgi:hypothetical protein
MMKRMTEGKTRSHGASSVLFALFLVSCSSSVEVTRLGEDTVTDVSGDWNDTDSRLVAKEMVNDVLAKGWLEEFRSVNARKPAVVVGKVANRSHEHIDVQTFVRDLERTLLNSGTIDFVASGSVRDQLRQEVKDQAKHAADETQKGPGQELGADFMLVGNISSIIDKEGGRTVRFYQVNLELVEIGTNKKVWIGEKKIKKLVSQDRLKL